MEKIMKYLKFLTASTFVAILAGVFFFNANAKVYDPPPKKKLSPCSITSGGEIIMIGNTCEGKGNGCSANPCN